MTGKSLERIDPQEIIDLNPETVALHLERYHFAGQHLSPGIVADIACGVGYGSYLLASEYNDKIKTILAVDVDAQSLAIAQQKYPHASIKYITADAVSFQSNIQLDTVVSLETIEHLVDPESFIRNISRQLVTGGRFITSVPVTPSVDVNPFHLHDFTFRSFEAMVTKHGFTLKSYSIQKQPYSLSLITRKKFREASLRQNILKFYIQNPQKLFLRLRSLFIDGFNNKYLLCVFEKI